MFSVTQVLHEFIGLVPADYIRICELITVCLSVV